MKLSKQQIAYCSNVHPGDDLPSVINNIQCYFSAVKQKRGLQQMASGLWLSANTAAQLNQDTDLLFSFKCLLEQQGLNLTSLNGFPYGNFHQKVVKESVYLPTWAQLERLEYTQQLAKILAYCLPKEERFGAISTLPLAYAKSWSDEQHHSATIHLIQLAEYLACLERESGKRIVVCIEMEPDCVLQSTIELIQFFKQALIPAAKNAGMSPQTLCRYIACCFDTCHQAVMGEDIEKALQSIVDAGIFVGKVQISNALSAKLTDISEAEQLTSMFNDDKFLHQTKVFLAGNLHREIADLNKGSLSHLLAQEQTSPYSLSIHYHIPINQTQQDLPLPFIDSTQAAILAALDFITDKLDYAPKLEIETYTWLNFLSASNSQDDIDARLIEGLVAEFDWLEKALAERDVLV
ncbi:metabolite traffic protein EboE [Agaribacter flavus]|uniref:Metabolite traffic protein EboE n=1 Tax=Agaribacter flavus TaxID=1902781 RepID=A0ABV7FPN3_9ALTE